jgi:hypothetical protein
MSIEFQSTKITAAGVKGKQQWTPDCEPDDNAKCWGRGNNLWFFSTFRLFYSCDGDPKQVCQEVFSPKIKSVS